MARSFIPRPAYYHVHVTKDGTIVMAFPDRKPARHKRERGELTDADGCFGWAGWDPAKPGLSDWAKGAAACAIATNLNLKKALRVRVESRLQAIEEKLNAAERRLIELADLLKRLDGGR